MGDMAKKKMKDSELSAKQIAKMRDSYSTKAMMGQGKPKSPYAMVKSAVKSLKARGEQMKKAESARREALKGKK